MAEVRHEIDYYDLDENKLLIRGVEVTALAEQGSFAAAIAYVLTGRTLEAEVLDFTIHEATRTAAASLDAAAPLCEGIHRDLDSASTIEAIVGALFAIRATRHLVPEPQNPLPELFDNLDWDAYLLFHQTILLAGLLVGGGTMAIERWRVGGGFHASSFALDLTNLFSDLFTSQSHSKDPRDSLLTCLIGGFGVAAPTTTLARFSASTRAPLEWALSASAMGCGPAHLGACSSAMQVLARALKNEGGSLESYCEHRPFPGFGHPIMPEDPRTSYLFAKFCNTLPQKTSQLANEVHAKFGIHPNIDLAAASIFLDWGVPAHLGSALFWISRIPILLAQACSKRREPAFGLRSLEAREKYREMPKHWV